jgi:putative DNA primase/helicase
MILDEISEVDPREIGAIVYSLANGSGKQRANRTGGARRSARWRIMVLSSGERSVAAHMGEAHKQAKAGQEARFLNIPVTGRAHGIFDCLHGSADGREFADRLKRATGADYGHAGRAFVKALIADNHDMAAAYNSMCNFPEFQTTDGLEARAAGVFALVAMAGELATGYGLTGWTVGEALRAAVEAFNVWRAFRGPGQTEDRQILQGVQDFILKFGDARFSQNNGELTADASVRDRAGYWRDLPAPDGSTRRVYYFNSPAMREAARGFDLGRILRALKAAGWIAEHDAGKNSKKVKVAGTALSLYAICPVGDGDAP